MGTTRHVKAKGKGKGVGKGKGKGGTKGKGGAKGGLSGGPPEESRWEIKESRVDLRDESRDEVLDLIRHLTKARESARELGGAQGPTDDDLATGLDEEEEDEEEEEEGEEGQDFEAEAEQVEPGGASEERYRAGAEAVSGGGGEEEEEEEEEDEEEEDDDEVIMPYGWDQEEPAGRHGEKRERRKLLQQLLDEDRHRHAVESAEAGSSGGPGVTFSGRCPGGEVRILIVDAAAMHQKPKSISAPRGGEGAVDRLLKRARQPLGIKGKKSLSAYLVSPDGRPCARLARTSDLVEGTLVAVSTRALQVNVAGGTSEAPPEKVEESAGALDAVRAAYAASGARGFLGKGAFGSLPPEEAREVGARLLSHSHEYACAEHLEGMRRARAALPAASARGQLLEALELSQVVIVVGETGSGKTTQCPNFILEAASEAGRGGEVAVVCTQPRRIAAVSVAERVAEERGEKPGGNVGYAVRLDSKVSRESRLLFCTTGVLLQQLNLSPDLQGVTHVVVDEAHERSLHTDFLLALLREVLQRRADLRVVVMSATLEQGLFQEYFAGFAFDPSDDLPVVHIAGRTHPLTIRYLGDALAAAGVGVGAGAERAAADDAPPDAELEAWVRRMHPARGGGGEEGATLVSPEVKRKADYDLIAGLCAAILSGGFGPEGLADAQDGAILVFLPGYVEIDRCLRTLRNHPDIAQRAWLLPLHGSLPIADQHRVFQRPPPGMRKIIVSTNIAETSVTIDDVVHVIDSGHVRETRFNPRSSMSVFSTVWVSQAAARQRAGRASRTRPGVCWRLYEQSFLEAKLPAHTLCEMRRTCLEDLVLQLRLLELGDRAGEFLQQAPEPPAPEAIAAAVQSLVAIGALVNSPGLPLTPLGFHLAHMPVDARVGKMLVYGALCCCLAPVLTVAACLSHRSPFARSFNRAREEQQRKEREDRFGHLCSDHLAAVAAFDAYRATKGGSDSGDGAALCDALGLSPHAINGIAQLRERFLRHLSDIGFAEPSADGGEAVNEHKGNLALVRCVITAGLFPNVVQVQRQGQGGRGSKVVLVSRELERCAVHPSSINSRQTEDFAANSSWLLFHVKVKTSQIFLQDSTLVGSIPLLLFGGELKLNKARTHIVVAGLQFRTKREATAVLLKLLRREIDRLLLLKVADPRAELAELAPPLLATVLGLLKLDGCAVSGLWRS